MLDIYHSRLILSIAHDGGDGYVQSVGGSGAFAAKRCERWSNQLALFCSPNCCFIGQRSVCEGKVDDVWMECERVCECYVNGVVKWIATGIWMVCGWSVKVYANGTWMVCALVGNVMQWTVTGMQIVCEVACEMVCDWYLKRMWLDCQWYMHGTWILHPLRKSLG